MNMPNKNTIFFLLSLVAGVSFVPRLPATLSSPGKMPPSISRKWIISKGSNLRVDGSTNINRFSCEIADYCSPDTILVNNGAGAGGAQGILLSGIINLGVSGFDCHNSMMTAELRKTIKATIYPRLSIRFVSLSRMPDPGRRPDNLQGVVDIALAGITRRVQINYSSSSPGRNMICLTGSQQLKFSDFGLAPPRKLGGMIRTSDRVDIEFLLNMSVIMD
jgi:hypothetical protein